MRNLLIFPLAAIIAIAADNPWEKQLRTVYESTGSDRADALDKLLSAPSVAVNYSQYSKVYKSNLVRQHVHNIEAGKGGQNLSNTAVSAGSTALASLAGAADSFSTALENGGFSQSSSGTVSTLTARPVAIVDALSGRNALACRSFLVLVRKDECSAEQYFKGLSFNVSLDTSRDTTVTSKPEAFINSLGQAVPLVSTGSNVVRLVTDPRSVSSWGAKYEVYNRRSPQNTHFMKAWNAGLDDKSVKDAADNLASNATTLLALFDKSNPTKADERDYKDWHDKAMVRLQNELDWEKLSQIWSEELERWANQNLVKTNPSVKSIIDARDKLVQAENKALTDALNQPIVSIQYTNSRPLNQPDLSNIKFLISKPFHVGTMMENGTPEVMFTFNAGFDLYNTIPDGAKLGRLRDVQAAMQLDIPAGKLATKGTLTFSLAAYYQYQIEKGLIQIGSGSVAPNTNITLPKDASALLTPKGGMFIAQAKMTLKATDAKTSVPIGVSWSNRTELIKADHVFSGHIGVLFDWNALLGKN